jgi:hypothetical protein
VETVESLWTEFETNVQLFFVYAKPETEMEKWLERVIHMRTCEGGYCIVEAREAFSMI